MIEQLTKELRQLIPFGRIADLELIQSLWSGYGSLFRVTLEGNEHASVIVKRITPPSNEEHPRGWNSDFAHKRKLKSYEVEATWYREYNGRSTSACRTPKLLGFNQEKHVTLLVLEDLDASGYAIRKSRLAESDVRSCLAWLANFHAQFMHVKPTGLWEIGTYWQLETRPEEYKAMPEGRLKENAHAIHEALIEARFQTLVHGDAKVANFCFSNKGAVAAVDFQYVGRGCGMKDVIYLLSCVEDEASISGNEEAWLNHYFHCLSEGLSHVDPATDVVALEAEWRDLYPVAWADFERFLSGWSPGHWKSTGYAKRQVQRVLSLM